MTLLKRSDRRCYDEATTRLGGTATRSALLSNRTLRAGLAVGGRTLTLYERVCPAEVVGRPKIERELLRALKRSIPRAGSTDRLPLVWRTSGNFMVRGIAGHCLREIQTSAAGLRR